MAPQYTRAKGSADVVYWQVGASCQPLGGHQKGVVAWGEVLADTTFEIATASTPAGIGRLRRTAYAWPSGAASTTGQWFDTELMEACTIADLAADASLRCLPQTAGVFAYGLFGDAACSNPLFGVEADGASCTPRFALTYTPSCDPRMRVLRIGAPHQGATYASDGTT